MVAFSLLVFIKQGSFLFTQYFFSNNYTYVCLFLMIKARQLLQLVHRSLGDGVRVRQLSFRYSAPNYKINYYTFPLQGVLLSKIAFVRYKQNFSNIFLLPLLPICVWIIYRWHIYIYNIYIYNQAKISEMPGRHMPTLIWIFFQHFSRIK